MIHKTAQLEGTLLDTAVALAEGWRLLPHAPRQWVVPRRQEVLKGEFIDTSFFMPQPLPWSSSWADGGLIIDREHITIDQTTLASQGVVWARCPTIRDGIEWSTKFGSGPSPLVAAMRAYVTSKLGDEIEIPR